jgi:hypothetical protein
MKKPHAVLHSARRWPKSQQRSQTSPLVKIVLEDLWSGDAKTLEQALLRLHKYLYDDDDAKFAANQKAIFQVGGHLTIVRVMKEYPNCKILQIQCIGVLYNAACKISSTETNIAKVEGIQVILAAMKIFPSANSIILDGFGALNNIICAHEANADLLVMKAGGIPFLVEAE